MRKLKKTYSKPLRPWDKTRIEEEKKLMRAYGLRRKREIWKAASILRSYRQRARNLAATKNIIEEKKLLEKLFKLGLLEKGATLTDVLNLTIENMLERRLQTIIYKKGLANTIKQARQFITHGHIAINKRRIVFPGFMVPRDLEDKIEYFNFEPKIIRPKGDTTA